MLIVYEHPLSPYSQKVKIALREKGIEFPNCKYPEGIGTGASGGAFAVASPRAEVPALIDGDTAIFDSTIILEYIEDKWPTPSLQPIGAAERARVRMIEEIVDTHYEAVNWGLGELHWFKRADGVLAETLDANAARQVQGFFAWLEKQLGDRAWFNGEAFGRGDLCVAPFVGTSRVWGHAPALGSKLAAWVERTTALASVGQTLAESFAFDRAALRDVAEMLAAGYFKREEFRDHRLEWMHQGPAASRWVLKGDWTPTTSGLRRILVEGVFLPPLYGEGQGRRSRPGWGSLTQMYNDCVGFHASPPWTPPTLSKWPLRGKRKIRSRRRRGSRSGRRLPCSPGIGSRCARRRNAGCRRCRAFDAGKQRVLSDAVGGIGAQQERIDIAVAIPGPPRAGAPGGGDAGKDRLQLAQGVVDHSVAGAGHSIGSVGRSSAGELDAGLAAGEDRVDRLARRRPRLPGSEHDASQPPPIA